MPAKRAQRKTSIFPLLLSEQDQPRMSILRYFKPPLPLYERESLLTHTRPRPSRASLEILFELEIFSDDAARPKIKSHENLSNENFANEKKANYGIHRGDWYFPNGTRLPFTKRFGIYEVHVCQRVDLRHSSRAFASGIYHCNIPTIAVHDGKHTSVRDWPVYVGLYDSDGGISLSASVNLHANPCI